MRGLTAVLFIALFVLPCCGEKDAKGMEKGRIKWVSSFSDAKRLARESKKPMMVSFFSDRCGWCRVLDQKTYSDPGVQELAGRFIPVKVDVGEDPMLSQQYSVMGLPTIIFMDSEGKVINKVIGFRDAEPFRAEMQKALNRAKGG